MNIEEKSPWTRLTPLQFWAAIAAIAATLALVFFTSYFASKQGTIKALKLTFPTYHCKDNDSPIVTTECYAFCPTGYTAVPPQCN